MSNTPLTDKQAYDGVVTADFARKLELELNEQVLLNGKGSEREYSLLGKIERLERENARIQMELDICENCKCVMRKEAQP